MISKTEIGQIAEDFAVEYLYSQGYEIREYNWRFKRAEIDIICYSENMLIFVEVKSRSSIEFGNPETAISAYKEDLILDAAQRYMDSIGYNWEIRFDVISVLFSKEYKLKKITHFKDAFFK